MSEIQLTPETIVCRSESILTNNLGEDVVMMDIEEGSYYGLEAVAASIWKIAEQPISIRKICHQLVGAYEVSADQCEKEVMAFVKDLIIREILGIVDSE